MDRTLEEMSRRLGVSRRSISRYLQGKGYLSKETRHKIAGFLKKGAYYPNVLGARLASRQVPVLGVVFPRLETHPDGGYYFFSVMQGIWAAAGRHGMQVTPFRQSPFQVEECLRIVKSKLAGGLLFVSPGVDDSGLFLKLKREKIPCVILNGRLPGVDCYLCDNRAGARDAVRHLIQQGSSRIAFIHGRKNWVDADERFAGYRAALEEAGRPVSPDQVEYGHYSIEGGEAAAAALLSRNPRPDAVFAANDLMAIGAVKTIRKNGLRIPDDIRLIGFDDIPFCGLPILEPTLSSVSQPFEAMADAAASRLTDLIRGKRPGRRAVHRFAPALVVRGSTFRK